MLSALFSAARVQIQLTVVGLVFGAFGECSQSVDLLVENFGKLVGEQGYEEMGYRTPEAGVGVATWAVRRGWSMTHWRESANLMWRNLEHVTGAYSEHAKRGDEAVHAGTRSTAARGATRTAQWGRTVRTAPAASVTTRRCHGPAGCGREQVLRFV